jgi:hypothetical protein
MNLAKRPYWLLTVASYILAALAAVVPVFVPGMKLVPLAVLLSVIGLGLSIRNVILKESNNGSVLIMLLGIVITAFLLLDLTVIVNCGPYSC